MNDEPIVAASLLGAAFTLIVIAIAAGAMISAGHVATTAAMLTTVFVSILSTLAFVVWRESR
jgi:hypothetical protein